MDFSRIGAVEADGAAYCAHAQPRVGGKNFNIRGPYRPDEESAKEDLDSMRAAARGMSRYRRPSVAGGTVALPFRD